MIHENLVSTDWLGDHLGEPDLRVIDCSWHLPTTGRDGADEFRAGHIPGAVFFDIDAIADTTSSLPHMLPDPVKFANEMTALGFGDGLRFVVYDSLGLYAAARVWWTLRAFGVEDVKILDGGLPKWLHEGRPIDQGDAHPSPRRFTARLDHSFVAGLAEVKKALATGSAVVVDVRPADRFEGRAPEPRPGVRSGHMPGSRNLPFSKLVDGLHLKSKEALIAAFAAAGVDLDEPIISMCGSGVTSAILTLAVEECGGKVAGLYDGSWAEWGARDDCPVATGPA